MQTQINTTIDPEEIERFSRIADDWWNPNGKFKPLHRMNPVRISWILEQLTGQLGNAPLRGMSLLDIGCGGGLMSEPMCRLGAQVTGIDAAEKNIKVAALHAKTQGLEIDYKCIAAEELAVTNARFDIVLALEIIEHVADIPAFVSACCQLVKPGGIIIWSTINRTAKAYALAIAGAEYILRLLPRGTHHWHKFVKPSELHAQLRHNDMGVTDMSGMTMNPLNYKWKLVKNDMSVNYILAAKRQS